MKLVPPFTVLCIIASGISYSLRKSTLLPIDRYYQSVITALADPQHQYNISASSTDNTVNTTNNYSFKELRFKTREKIPHTALDINLDINVPLLQLPTIIYAQTGFNNIVYTHVHKTLQEFFALLPTAAESIQAQKDGRNVHYDCCIKYHLYYATDTLISIRLYTFMYTGGAHGTHDYTSITYDLKTGQKLELADIFMPKYNFLDTLSTYCATELKKRNNKEQFSTDTYITKGTAPKPKNYVTWNYTPEGLLITYNVYQVAPYCAGAQEVIIPYNIIKKQLVYSL